MSNIMKTRKLRDGLKRVGFFYFPITTLVSALFFAYFYFPLIFGRIDFIYGGAVVFSMVLTHHFLYHATGLDKRFSSLHYIVPALVYSALAAAKLLLSAFSLFHNSVLTFYIILIFAAFYTILNLFEIHRFYVRQSITYGSTNVINHHRLLLLVFEILFFACVFGLFPLIGGQQPGLTVSLILMVFILSALFNNIPFVYSMIRYFAQIDSSHSLFDSIQSNFSVREKQFGTIFAEREVDTKYVEMLDSDTESGDGKLILQSVKQSGAVPESPVKRFYRKYSHRHRVTGQLIEIDKTVFERYFRKHKPYLNPHLTINDLTGPLQCNRTYLSKFINRVYGMNFRSYVNSCRLREMERLMATPGNRTKTPASLCSQAGFVCYRNYLKAKNSMNPDDISV